MKFAAFLAKVDGFLAAGPKPPVPWVQPPIDSRTIRLSIVSLEK